MRSYSPEDFAHGADVLAEACELGDAAARDAVIAQMLSDLSAFNSRSTFDLEAWLRCVGHGQPFDVERFNALHSPILLEHSERINGSVVKTANALDKGRRAKKPNAGKPTSLLTIAVREWTRMILPTVPMDASDRTMLVWALFWDAIADENPAFIDTDITDRNGELHTASLVNKDLAIELKGLPHAAIQAHPKEAVFHFAANTNKHEEKVRLSALYKRFHKAVQASK